MVVTETSQTNQFSLESSQASRPRQRRDPPSQLALDTFAAFLPYINIWDCGIKYDDEPKHMITKEDWKNLERYKATGLPQFYKNNGNLWKPHHLFAGKFTARYIDKGISGQEVLYYTSSPHGGIIYSDLDNHEEWQTDAPQVREHLEGELGTLAFWNGSPRGENGYTKVRFDRWQTEFYNEAVKEWQAVLQDYIWSLGYLTTVEAMGGATSRETSAKLAKLPFNKNWTPARLEEWKATSEVTLEKFYGLIGWIKQHTTDTATLEATRAKYRELKERSKAKNLELTNDQRLQLDSGKHHLLELAAPANGDTGGNAPGTTDVGPSHESVGSSGGSVPVLPDFPKPKGSFPSESSLREPSEKTLRAISPDCRRSAGAISPLPGSRLDRLARAAWWNRPAWYDDPDSFRRQFRGLLEYCRQLRRVVSVEEGLDMIQARRLYTGEWTDRLGKRTKRVIYILRYIARTFDSAKCGRRKKRELVWTVELENLIPGFRQVAHVSYDKARECLGAIVAQVHVCPEFAWEYCRQLLVGHGVPCNAEKAGNVIKFLEMSGLLTMIGEWFYGPDRKYGRQYELPLWVRFEDEAGQGENENNKRTRLNHITPWSAETRSPVRHFDTEARWRAWAEGQIEELFSALAT